ncbi:MAG TPA: Cof-type HAD-IIB family hydrolase [Pyrinomonadaceae bacterium]|nr:Cof-type HAD-IIB family hydrolase [Pyrinomonadaceae bacterium]
MSKNDDFDFSTVRTGTSTRADGIRLLVLDLDGTIVDESNQIRDSAIQAIRSAQRHGVAVALATGRMFRSSLGAYESIEATLPLICHEGALIRQPQTDLVHRHWPMEPRLITAVLDETEHLRRSGRLSVHCYVQDDLYVSNLNEASSKFFDGSTVVPVVVSDVRALASMAITKAMVVSDDAQAIARVYRRLKNSSGRIRLKEYKSTPFLEVFHPSVNKRLAVSYLAEELLGLRPENVMAIGDDYADIEMLEYAGIGVAMGNAPAAVKACADWVTTTIEQDGVVKAVKKWVVG